MDKKDSTEEFLTELILARQQQSDATLSQDSVSFVADDTIGAIVSQKKSIDLDEPKEVMHGHSIQVSYLDQTTPKSMIPVPDDTVQQQEQTNDSPVNPIIKPEISLSVFNRSPDFKNRSCNSLRYGISLNHQPIVPTQHDESSTIILDDTIKDLSDDRIKRARESLFSFKKEIQNDVEMLENAESLREELNKTVEMVDLSGDQQIQAAKSQSNLTYIVPTSVTKLDRSTLIDDSDKLDRTLNETQIKLTEIEDKILNLSHTSFRQTLANAKLNRSTLKQSPNKSLPQSSNQPPLKQARLFNRSASSPGYNIAPTVVQTTPQSSVRKSRLSSSNDMKAFSTPTRQIIATSNLHQVTPRSRSVQRLNLTTSVLRTVKPEIDSTNHKTVAFNPLYGPVALKATKDLKWAQQLEFDPNWLDEIHEFQWIPLPDDYFDHNGVNAGLKKDELRRKAEKILVRTINKFEGNMSAVRKYLFELAHLNEEHAKSSKSKMLRLKKKHDQLVKHYNDRVDYHNRLVKMINEKKQVEESKFVEDIKRKIQRVYL